MDISIHGNISWGAVVKTNEFDLVMPFSPIMVNNDFNIFLFLPQKLAYQALSFKHFIDDLQPVPSFSLTPWRLLIH